MPENQETNQETQGLRLNQTVLDSLQLGILVYVSSGKILSANAAACRMLDTSWIQLLADDQQTYSWTAIDENGHPVADADMPAQRAMSTGKPINNALLGLKFDNQIRWLEFNCEPLINPDESLPHTVVASFMDITARRQADEGLRLAANVFKHSQEAIMVTEADGSIIEVNPAFTRITGYEREEVLGHNPRLLNSGRQDRNFYQTMWQGLNEQGVWFGEVWNRRKNGEVYAQMQTISAIRNESDKVLQYVAVFSDITALKDHQREIEHILHHDVLTRLPNRVLLGDRMRQMLMRAKRTNELVGVLVIDLDGFKEVNDRHGHEAGDQILIDVAGRIVGCVRAEDTASRLGGDEFVVLIGGITSRSICELTINRLLASLAMPFYLGDGNSASISGSIGYTIYPEDDVDPDTLLRHADHAMYLAKQAGKNRFHRFDIKLDTRAKANWSALARIEKALDKNEFRLYIQPKVALDTGKVVGAEALIRWQHPIRGIVPPAQFLPLIDGQDMALKVGNWVLREGMNLLQAWGALGLMIPLSVNVDARQLRELDFSVQLGALLDAYPDVSPEQLEIEIVESAALDDIQKVSLLIEECRTLGVRFALDDFGTGYSSLTYLKRLSVDTLKIDQTFVRDMLGDDSAMAIVRAVIGLASAFRSHTVAEGVETWEHAAKLKQWGCEIAQGYAIARPMPAEEFPAWVNSFTMPKL